jgi:branched-chain amino acid aminotransferase
VLQKVDPKNREILVNVNGKLANRDEAAISPFDSAVQGGDAVWEGLRLYRGRIFRLTAHLARLRRSAQALSFAAIPSDDAIRREIRRTLEANGMFDGVHVRLTLTRGVKVTSGMDPRLNRAGPTLIVLAEHKAPVYDKSGIALVTSSVRRPPPEWLDQRIHSCNMIPSILAKIEANAAGVDDALMLDNRGFLAETNATHVFVVEDGTVSTPDTVACPEGITRGAILDLCERSGIPCRVADISPEEIPAADEMFCTGTMGEIVPVVRVDGRSIGSGGAGPVTLRLSELFAELTRHEGEVVV